MPTTSPRLSAQLHPGLAAAVVFALVPLARIAFGPAAVRGVPAALEHLRTVRRAIMAAQGIEPGYRAQLVEQLELVRHYSSVVAELIRREAPGSDGNHDHLARAEELERLGESADDTLLALDALASL